MLSGIPIAAQQVHVGIGLSTIGMLAAAGGYLTPIQGALLQEVIDVAVILNALIVLREPVSRSELQYGWRLVSFACDRMACQ